MLKGFHTLTTAATLALLATPCLANDVEIIAVSKKGGNVYHSSVERDSVVKMTVVRKGDKTMRIVNKTSATLKVALYGKTNKVMLVPKKTFTLEKGKSATYAMAFYRFKVWKAGKIAGIGKKLLLTNERGFTGDMTLSGRAEEKELKVKIKHHSPTEFVNDSKQTLRVSVYKKANVTKLAPHERWEIKPGSAVRWKYAPTEFRIRVSKPGKVRLKNFINDPYLIKNGAKLRLYQRVNTDWSKEFADKGAPTLAPRAVIVDTGTVFHKTDAHTIHEHHLFATDAGGEIHASNYRVHAGKADYSTGAPQQAITIPMKQKRHWAEFGASKQQSVPAPGTAIAVVSLHRSGLSEQIRFRWQGMKPYQQIAIARSADGGLVYAHMLDEDAVQTTKSTLDWKPVPDASGVASKPVASAEFQNTREWAMVAYRHADGQIRYAKYRLSSDTWTAWSTIEGQVESAPAVAWTYEPTGQASGHTRYHFFALANGGRLVHAIKGAGAQPWTQVDDQVFVGNPAADGIEVNGRELAVVTRGSDGDLFLLRHLPEKGWQETESLGGTFDGDPAVFYTPHRK